MKNKTPSLLLIFLLLLSVTYAQQGTVSGVLLGDDNLPLPGVNITIKGTTVGTQTDFDGNYSLQCNAGDTLIFTYIGFSDKEVLVTLEMFGQSSDKKIEYIPVILLKSNAYSNAVKGIEKKDYSVLDFGNSYMTYNKKNSYFQYNRIKEIDINKNKVKLTYFSPDVYFEIVYNSSFGVEFVKNKNLPELQNIFSQGLSTQGKLTFQGAETGTIFSYGPALNSLEFNGSNYIYDVNGMLVNQGNGNDISANTYDNSIFENALNTSNNLFFNITTDSELFGFNFSNETSKDIYNRKQNTSNKIILNYKKNKEARKLGWKSFISYQTTKDNQANINGFQNNLLLNLYTTPPSFSNRQNAIQLNNLQRSFTNRFNNPEWLLNYNRNSVKDKFFIASIQNDIDITDDIKLESKISYNYNNQEQEFGLVNGTIGFNDGFSSSKNIKNKNLSTILNFNYKKYKNNSEIEIKSIVNYNYENLNFSLQRLYGFIPFTFINPQNGNETKQSKFRNTFRLLNQFKYEINYIWELNFINNSYYSSIQNSKWFLPSLYIKIDLKKLFYIPSINKLSISSTFSFDINDSPLYYNNLSHNSLLITPQESLAYTSNNDLFINSSISPEEKENFEVSASLELYLLGGNTNFDFTYYNSTTKGSVFPIINNGGFELSNVANIKNRGFEFSIDSRIRIANDFHYKTRLSFSTYRTKVLTLLNNKDRIPIAGFSSISKNLIVGQPAGVIVGSAYARDNKNNIIIGKDGFPLVAPDLQIIGNPVPDFNIGFSNTFKWKKIELNVAIDIQKGGDTWNGTQNVLNYIGASQQSAIERNITDFVFNGVDENGNINTNPVDFYNPNNPILDNRFVRYGFDGIGEEAIVDASYINIKSAGISYSLFNNYRNNNFLRECKLGIYANNIFTWSSYRGHSPYNALYGSRSGQELNFFNSPLQSEIGLTLKLKI